MVDKAEKNRKVLVTGACGMLGRDIWKVLSGAFDLYGVDIVDTGCCPDYERADITDGKSFKEAVKRIKPDFIIHAAAWTDVDGCEKDTSKADLINVIGTKNVVEAASAGIPVIYISTDFVFDGKKNGPYNITDNPAPLSHYGRTKLEGERAVSKLDSYAIVRTSWLYGKNGKNFVDTILKKATDGEKLRVVDDQKGSPTYTKDLARALGALLLYLSKNIGAKGTFHCTNKGVVSWFDYARTIAEMSGIAGADISPMKSSELDRPAKRPAYSALDVSGFENATGHKMREWKEALKEYLNEKKQS